MAINLNNPGNIRISKDKWQGLADNPVNKEFFTFKTPDFGIRAMAVLLIGYYDREGLDTINTIIPHYAPPSENDTAAYIKDVSRETIFTPDKKLNLHEYSDIFPLIKAMIRHENGSQPYTDDIINMGLARAGVEIPKKSIMLSKSIKGAATALVGVSGDLGTTLLDNTPVLAQYADTSHYLHAGCAALTASGIALTIIGKFKSYAKSIT